MWNGCEGAWGLDLGTSRLVLARASGPERLQYLAQRNAFVALPYSRVTQLMLEREEILHAVDEDEILIYGNRSDEFANLVDGDTRRPMRTGLLNPNEPRSLQVIKLALTRLCQEAPSGGRICFSSPSPPPDFPERLIFHERTVQQILEGLGYRVKTLNEGLAIVYSELEADNFTGIGVSFGGGMCNVCVAYLGLPVLAFATTRAGDYIDQQSASVSGRTVASVRLHKEVGFALNGLSTNSVDQALSVYYGDVIETAMDRLEVGLRDTNRLPKLELPLTMAVAGGTAMVGRFRDELEASLRKRKLPVEIGEVRLAADPLHATARGALMAAALDL